MSSGMNMAEAEKIADKMSYREAVMNCLCARCVPYRKATKIKMKRLLESIDNDKPLWKSDEHFITACNESYQQGKTDGINKCLEIVQKIKDEHIDSKFIYPINYGTLCGIIIELEQLKENKE